MKKKSSVGKETTLCNPVLKKVLLAAVSAVFLWGSAGSCPSAAAQDPDWDSETGDGTQGEKKTSAKKTGDQKSEDTDSKTTDSKGDKKASRKDRKTKIGKSSGSKKAKKEKKEAPARDRRSHNQKKGFHGDGTREEYEFNGKPQKVADYVKNMMVKVPPGEFLMGSPSDEPGRGKDERQHKVKISEEFYIGKYEVTQDFYLAVMGRRNFNPLHYGKNRPMENVSWAQAVAFCRELNALEIAPEGYYFCLPTEAQWEYAARGGDKGSDTMYPGGKNIDDVAVYSENGKDYTRADDKVGQMKPNALKIFDMSGSVAEWCLDWYAPYPRTKEVLVDPRGPRREKYAAVTMKVLKGGNWSSSAADCRIAARIGRSMGTGLKCGIRLVLVKIPGSKSAAPAPKGGEAGAEEKEEASEEAPKAKAGKKK
ncbi:MAG: formylglycine-generating enzyme family protein [Lentisphaeria bacterium]|nr:formylglycine-generating enzyme family protein [Lentisphaeria bacterium]